ncbi:hypothetical protein GCM10008098_00270 [Rhodanobacter panaciterrae]|uniref:PH domain-containing protein n=1 Tax=Rhodanobacter panaciterrae TaxID=490572 RepID=A0ABQ2ZH41_9GAMM|nr:PH domain-containing protein [Rhodanobacter panaciterrae]GGY13591.1 hypothetical protein GCM10008098_00270 [Rhodanobacter panaciterrae]
MTFEVDQKLRPELARGERLLWSGMPQQGLRWRTADWFAVPFTLFWLYMLMFGTFRHGIQTDQPPLYLMPEGIPFVLVGFYMLAGRFLVDWYQRTRTYYGLTDQRVIILGGLFNRQIKSVTLATLSDITLSARSNGSGTITFGPGASTSSWFGRSSWGSVNNQQAPAFDMIEDVRKVYAMTREAQQANRIRAVV